MRRGHEIRIWLLLSKLNEDISKLTNKKGDLEVENARLTSLKEVKDSSVAKNMSTPSNVSYVSN